MMKCIVEDAGFMFTNKDKGISFIFNQNECSSIGKIVMGKQQGVKND